MKLPWVSFFAPGGRPDSAPVPALKQKAEAMHWEGACTQSLVESSEREAGCCELVSAANGAVLWP